MDVRQALRALRATQFPRVEVVHTRYADLDPQRHVNNAALGTLFAEARSGIAHEVVERAGREPGFVMMVAQFAVSYVGQVCHPRALEVGVGVIETGPKFVRVVQALFQDGTCRAVAESVLLGTRDSRGAELPEAVRVEWLSLALPDGLVPRQLR